MRLVALVLVAGCLGKSQPPVDHEIELSITGLSPTGPASYVVKVNLDTRMLESSVPGDEITTTSMHTRGPAKLATRRLSQGDVDELRRLALAARYEEPPPDHVVSDHAEHLRFDGEPAKSIDQTMLTGPVAKQLANRLRGLAGW